MRLFLAVVCLFVLAMAGLTFWIWQSVPKMDGTIAVSGPVASVEILRDRFGIPHIYAETADDAYFGLGYAHTQDRMFQMEQQRRLSQGRLSEIPGSSTLEYDRFLHLLDLHRATQASVAAPNPSVRESLDAYAAGVNAFVEAHEGALSPEFALSATPQMDEGRSLQTMLTDWQGEMAAYSRAPNGVPELVSRTDAQHLCRRHG